MRRPGPADDGERGETLLELVVAIVILGVCVVAIGSDIALSVKMSDVHRKQAVAQEFLHNDAEIIQAQLYLACTSSTPAPDYVAAARIRGLLPDPPNGGPWTTSQSAIKYWSNGTFSAGCPGNGTDPGLQQVTLELKSRDGFVDESLVVVLRSNL